MPNLTPSLSVTVQGTETLVSALDIYIRNLDVELDVAVSSEAQQPLPTDVALAFEPQIDAQLDMWVSIGGAASQLFQLDTQVTTPLISGDHVISDTTPTAQFLLSNLDLDVVSLTVGPSAVGVVSVSGFVNNGDGTGTFFATFDISIPSRYLTIVAVDDVDNESAETPVYVVNSLEQARLNDVLSIAPQETVSTPTCDRLLDSVPPSNFVLKRQYNVAYSFDPTVFELRTVTPNSPVEIVVVRRGLPGDVTETQRYVVIPQTETQLISIRLGRGTNVVTAYDSFGRGDTAIVATTTYAAVLCSYAREIYNFSRVEVDEQETAIFSPVSTRLAEPLLRFTDLLPDVRSQQVLAAKLAIRSLVSDPGRQIGVRDMLTALTLSTPIFVPQQPDEQYFDPTTRPMFNSQEAFAGVEAHVWLANACVQRWLAFINYIQNADAFQLLEVSESEVLFRDNNGDVQRHTFDFTAEECSLTTLALQALCFDTIDILIAINSTTDIKVCAAAYPLDMRPVPSDPVRPLGDEFGIELALDPGFDGYVDFSVTSHWDSTVTLDSQGAVPSVASGESTCVYSNGFAVRPVLLASVNTTIDAEPSIAITTDVQTAVGAVLDLLLAANDVELTAALDMNVQLTYQPTRSVQLGMVVIGTETATAGLDVLVSA